MLRQIIPQLANYFYSEVPRSILANFILLLIFIYLCRKPLGQFFKNISRNTWLWISLIFVFGLLVRLFISSHSFLTIFDEAEYMETATNLSSNFQQGVYVYPRSIGWPFILAVVFKLFGPSYNAAFYTSSALGALTVFNIFLLALALSKKENVAIWSAFLFSVLPLHIKWSGSAETNVPSLFFITLGLFFCALYFRNPDPKQAQGWLSWLVLIGLSFASQFRPENYALFGVFLIGLLIFAPSPLRKFKLDLVWPLFLALIVTLPNLFVVLNFQISADWIFRDSSGVLSGSNWSLENLINNSLNYGKYFFTTYHSFIFSILYFGGAVYLFLKKRKIFFFLMGWFLLFYFIYFSSWLQTLGAKSRIFLTFYPILAISAAFFIDFISQWFKFKKLKIIWAINLIIIFLTITPYYIENLINKDREGLAIMGKAELAILELAKNKVPSDCTVVANLPVIFVTTGLKAVDFKHLEDYSYNSRCLLFFDDFTCYQRQSGWPEHHENCEKIKKYYYITPFLTHSERDFPYILGFYRILGPKNLIDMPNGNIELKSI